MAHQQQQDFCLSVRNRLPEFFSGVKVLDCGSLDINGANNYLFDKAVYTGIDVGPGKNVDIVCKTHEFDAPDGSFDVVVSTECFEHDMYYQKSLVNIVRLLRSGGLFLFTCATTGRPEHGTRRTTPQDAPLVMSHGSWGDYYKNLTEADVREVLDVDAVFSRYEFSGSSVTKDLYFWGIKAAT